jgi:hypothetical protein
MMYMPGIRARAFLDPIFPNGCETAAVYGKSGMADPQKYCDQAKRLRLQAALANDTEVRQQMIDIAAQYERLAASIEARKKDPR